MTSSRPSVILTRGRMFTAIRDALLPKLLSGQIRVTDAGRVAEKIPR